MEECESLDSDMTELQEVQSEASEALSQDDEDEEEELRNSLREAVQDQSVKPQLQCLMVDQSFSMVTVQSEDSGIVWETASSRCSTPWASETSSTSEAYSMEGPGAAGKITIVFDEEKVIRRRTRSGGRSRLGDRLSRPGSSRSASVLGVERPEMAGVSLPNIKKEKSETEPDLEEIKNKDQQLFSLISEGYEILNIRVPSKLPTVDEEESTELKDNLSYLDQTPMIRSRNNPDWTQNPALQEEGGEVLDPHELSKQDSSQLSEDTAHRHALTQKESTVDIDYFEPFTMVDVAVPEEDEPEQQEEEEEQPAAKPNVEEQKETATDSLSASEDSFDFVTDVDIVGEHLDEVFYGEGAPADALQRSDEDEAEGRMGMRLESQRSVKEKGSVLFGGEDTILTPIFISSGPPKIIDQILLDEPTAMSFMYSDLYEDAVGERTRSDEEHSEAESVSSEKTYRRRFSDSEEDGYLEKFTLKDDIPSVEVQPESEEGRKEGQKEGRVIWSQNRFDMTGCLTRVEKEEEKDKTVVEDKSEDLQSATFEEKGEIVAVAGKEQEIQLSAVTEEQAVRGASEELIQDIKPGDDQMEDQEVKHEVKEDQIQPDESHTEKPLPETQQVDSKVEKAKGSEEHETVEAEQPRHTRKGKEETAQVEVSAAAPGDSEEPHIIPEKSLSEESTDTKMAAASGNVETEAITERQEMHTSTEIETSICGKQEAAEGVPVEVLADCDAAVHALVEVTEKAVDEKEIQTQVQIDLQELTSTETKDIQTAAPEGEDSALTDETAVESQSPELIIDIAEADQEPEVKAEISSEVVEPERPEGVKIDSQETQHESRPDSELTPEAKDETSAEVTGSVAQEKVNVDDEFILLVPKGQAVEVDIEFSQTSEKSTSDPVALSEPDSTCETIIAPEPTAVCRENLQAPNEETTAETHLEVKQEVAEIETLRRNELDAKYSPPATTEEEGNAEEQKMELDFVEDEGVVSTLRSFTPQEDLSELQPEEIQTEAADVEQKVEMPTVEEAPETSPVKEDFIPERDLHKEDGDQKIEQDVEVAEAQEDIVEELGYEIISKQDVKKMPEPEIQRDAEEPKLESGQEKEQRMEMEEAEEQVLDVSPEEELIEADYDIIDAEEQSQAQLAAELQGMDWFCLTCGGLLAEDDCSSEEHHDHEVTAVDQAYEEIKEKLSDWISELQGRSENIEDLVSELELAYNSVEDQFVESEAAMQAQNEGMMVLVMEQYNNMSVSMEEEKKAKLEQLYDQIVSFQESIDSAKATLETTAREAETDARSPDEIHASLKAALDSAMSLELGPKGLLVFEDYAKGNTSSSNLAQRKGIPVPQRPTLQAQEPGSASSTSVTVYWKVNPGDIIDCFQVYCMEDPQGAVSEEYRVTVKESYCVLEELEPDKTYKVWVMAVNYTGCSLPSERLTFRTAPSVPMIDTERCTVMWDSATLRWGSTNLTPEQSYTLEYCRQYELEGEGLRSISAIRSCEQKVLLQPNENYLFYIKAVNESGASEQSEAALISSKGTRFHLLKASAHPALELSVDQTTVHYSQDAHENTQSTDTQCPSILGELLPAHGHYYWETVVSRSTAYRIGVADSTANRNSPLGENSLSWCLQCISTPSGCSYQLLHNDVQSSVFVMELPERVGTLLDYKLGRLSFYNAQSGQLLGSFCQRFPQPCHPALGLEVPGSLEVSMVQEVPEFTKDS